MGEASHMSYAEATRFTGRCRALLLGLDPLTKRDLLPFFRVHFPRFATSELPPSPSRQELSTALKDRLPTFCLLEVGKNPDHKLTVIADLLALEPKLWIVVILQNNDANFILRSLRSGAGDFLLPPFTPDQFEAAAQKIVKQFPPTGSSDPGRVYCVIPAKGGCGATTLACNLTYQWKRFGSKRILLADLDPLTGVVSFLLKLKSSYSFLDVMQRSADIDSDMWKVMVTNRLGVDVLLAPEKMVEAAATLTDAGDLIDYARFHYETTIIDAGSAYGEWNLSLAQASDELLLVVTNELASLHGAQRSMAYFDQNGIDRSKTHLIVDRYDPNTGLSRDVIEQALRMDIYLIIPSDKDAVQKALMQGKPVPDTTAFGKSVVRLAERLSGHDEAPSKAKSSALAALFQRFSRSP